jgi:hypothetical protein
MAGEKRMDDTTAAWTLSRIGLPKVSAHHQGHQELNRVKGQVNELNIFCGAIVAGAISAGMAMATPGLKFTGTVLQRSKIDDRIEIKTGAREPKTSSSNRPHWNRAGTAVGTPTQD